MRFERLELERYGHFTGHSIDFGALSKEGDFHLIYGPNEAGKSTLRDACIDFLFGFERITPYNFKHPNASLLIGAELSINDEKFIAQRVKRNTQSLRDQAGEPILDGVLKAALGDVSRTHYLQMFSLDEDTLVDGGDEILKSQGDLGALLFSAASGLSTISSSLDIIQEKADGFYKPSGRSFRLNEHLKKLKDLKDELKELDLQAPAYERWRKEVELAKTAHVEAKQVQDEKLAHVDKLNALLQAAEIHTEYLEVTDLLSPLHDAPDVADGLREQVEKLYRDIAAQTSQLVEMQRGLERLNAAYKEIEPDEVILENEAAIHRLSEGDMEARYQTSSDIEHRERDVAACGKDIQTLLRKLGQPDNKAPRALLISASVLGNVRELLDQNKGIQVDIKNAAGELKDAREKSNDAQIALENFKELSDLSDVFVCLNKLKLVAELEISRIKIRLFQSAQSELKAAIAALAPWKGEPASLREVTPPNSSVMQKLITESQELWEKKKNLVIRIAQLDNDIASQNASLATLKLTSGLVDDQTAQAIRMARVEAWAKHVAEIESGKAVSQNSLRETAKTFETILEEDDETSRVRFSQSSELAEFKKIKVDLAKSEALLLVAEKQKSEVGSRIDAIEDRISELAGNAGLPPSTDLNFLFAWLEKYRAALGRSDEYLAAKNELEDYEKNCQNALQELQKAMQSAGVLSSAEGLQKNDPQALIAQCETAVDEWKDKTFLQDQAKKAVADAAIELKRRFRQYEKMQELKDEWQENWKTALAGTWLSEALPVEVRYNLQLLDELEAIFVRLDDTQERIAGMKHNRALYVDEVNRLARATGMETVFDDGDQASLHLADQLRRRLATAEENQRRQKERWSTVLEHEERLHTFQDKFQMCQFQAEVLFKQFAVDDLDELLALLKRGDEKARLQAEAGRLGRNICRTLGARSLEVALEVLQDQCATREKLDELRRERSSLNQDRDDEQEHLGQLYHQWKDAEMRLAAVGDDASVARLEEERQVLLLQVEQEARSYMRLMAGTLMVGEALRTYRDVHRSAMMQRASEAFVLITGGNFSGLTSAPGKNGDILVGIRSDGTSIEVSQMSRGTAFQLYLALRIAGHAEFAKSRETLPFFADDILEPFDDDRSAETFKLLAEMSKLGQVVYLTHHKHLCQIARDVCGDAVRIHELPGTVVAG